MAERVDALWDEDDEWGNVSLSQGNPPIAKGEVPVKRNVNIVLLKDGNNLWR